MAPRAANSRRTRIARLIAHRSIRFNTRGVTLTTDGRKNPGKLSTATATDTSHGGTVAFDFTASQRTTFLAAATLLTLALAPTWLRAHGNGLASLAIVAFFSRLCHQHAERSFVLFGTSTAVCARCLGIYAGAALGSLIRLDHRPALRCLGIAVALNVLDVAAELSGLHGNLPLTRLLVGGVLGAAAGAMLATDSWAKLTTARATHCRQPATPLLGRPPDLPFTRAASAFTELRVDPAPPSNFRHPSLTAIDMSAQVGNVQVRIQVGPVEAGALRSDFDLCELTSAAGSQT